MKTVEMGDEIEGEESVDGQNGREGIIINSEIELQEDDCHIKICLNANTKEIKVNGQLDPIQELDEARENDAESTAINKNLFEYI